MIRRLPRLMQIVLAGCGWLAGLSLPAVAGAQELTPPPPPLKLSFGLDTRVREVTLHNLRDLDNGSESGLASDAHFFRVRHRIRASASRPSGLGLHSRFTTEWRKYLDPWRSPEKTEVIIDQLYLEVPELPYVPASLRIGRLDLQRGEGFVLMDGTPGDGSRTIYHNAAVVEIDGAALGLAHSRLTAFALHNPVRDDLVLANDAERALVEKDETAFGIFAAARRFETDGESYYIYKDERGGDDSTATPSDARTHTLGQRLSGKLPWSLEFAAEGAYQFGERLDRETHDTLADVSAYGGYLWLQRSFAVLLFPSVRAGLVMLSGDDPNTEDHEAWNPLFSRWPKWSELYIYTLIPETGRVAYWQNLLAWQLEAALKFGRTFSLTYGYQRLRALERATGSLFGDGLTRGDLHTWRLTGELSSSVSTHFLVERLNPGDFYAGPRHDAYFLRWELLLRK